MNCSHKLSSESRQKRNMRFFRTGKNGTSWLKNKRSWVINRNPCRLFTKQFETKLKTVQFGVNWVRSYLRLEYDDIRKRITVQKPKNESSVTKQNSASFHRDESMKIVRASFQLSFFFKTKRERSRSPRSKHEKRQIHWRFDFLKKKTCLSCE